MVVHDNSDNNNRQNHDIKCSTQILEPNNKKIKNTQPKFQEYSNKQIPHKQWKIQKLEERVLSLETEGKSQQ